MRNFKTAAVLFITAIAITSAESNAAASAPEEAALAKEVAGLGWIVYSSRGADPNGAYDLYACRPDGSQKFNMTNTPEFEEGGPRYTADGTKLLYRRYAKGTIIPPDHWGFHGQLVIAAPDGANSEVIGAEGEFPWATFSADGSQVACLSLEGIKIFDLQTKTMIRRMPRAGIYQQLSWSDDGKWFCGVANAAVEWTIVRMNAENGQLNVIHPFQSCTPEWFTDSHRLIYSSRPAGQSGHDGYGYTQLWMSDGEGTKNRLVFGEDGYHIYGGEASPNGKYALFSKLESDGGGSDKSGAPIYLMRLEDAPTIKGDSRDLRKVHPSTKDGTVLNLGITGWEPEWTNAELRR